MERQELVFLTNKPLKLDWGPRGAGGSLGGRQNSVVGVYLGVRVQRGPRWVEDYLGVSLSRRVLVCLVGGLGEGVSSHSLTLPLDLDQPRYIPVDRQLMIH